MGESTAFFIEQRSGFLVAALEFNRANVSPVENWHDCCMWTGEATG